MSQYQVSTDSDFAAQTHRTSDGKLDTNITETVVPVPVAPPGVPEPTTLALAGLGLPLVGAARLLPGKPGRASRSAAGRTRPVESAPTGRVPPGRPFGSAAARGFGPRQAAVDSTPG